MPPGDARHVEISEAFLADLRSRVNLPAMVGRGIQLRRSGKAWTGLCPFHGERNPSFAVYADGFHCFGCGARGDCISWVMQEQRVPFLEAVVLLAQSVGLEAPIRRQVAASRAPLESVAAPGPPVDTDEQRASRSRQSLAMWLAAQPQLLDTPVDDYLRNRHVDVRALPRPPKAIRFAPRLWCEEVQRELPGMLAAITNGAGEHVATHRTWLQCEYGRWIKARLEKPKMVLGGMRGGSIRLSRGASGKPLSRMPDGERVLIGEGIETCLTVAIACPEFRVLAAVSLNGMGLIELPAQANHITLLADNDLKPTARHQMARVVNHHIAAGREVLIARSPTGNDFNDAA